jgi:hypothetical protein
MEAELINALVGVEAEESNDQPVRSGVREKKIPSI